MKTVTQHTVLVLLGCMLSAAVDAQLVIQSGTSFGFSSDKPDIIIQAAGDITTNNATDFSAANLQLILTADLALAGNLTAAQLTMTAGKTLLNGNLTVTQGMNLSRGIFTPASTSKILFTGDGHAVTGGNDQSYINGIFYQSGGGYSFFPIGVNGAYTPATFENISSPAETGVKAIATEAALIIDDPTAITSIDPAHHWVIVTDDPTNINTRVSLSLTGITPSTEGTLAVVQADAVGGIATNLGVFSIDDTQVTSRSSVIKPLLAIGTIPRIVIKVRDLITPFDAADNNGLYIERIEAFNFNTVTLMDRWGVAVKRWENFTNDVDYDFTQLSPGNYIVLVECRDTVDGNPAEKISQMVTVLKTN